MDGFPAQTPLVGLMLPVRILCRMSTFHSAQLSAFGAVMEIACTDREILKQGIEALPGYWLRSEGGRPDVCFGIETAIRRQEGEKHFLFRENGKALGSAINGAQALHRLAKRMDYYLGAYARDCAFLHSGVILHNGRAVLIPGLSHTGKSTLTAALVRIGAHYVSDDVAVIDRTGRAYFLSRAISLREDVAEAFDFPFAANFEFLREGTLPVEAILLLNYCKGEIALDMRPLSKGETALRLIANCMNGRNEPETAIHCCVEAVRQAICCEGVRGEAEAVAPLILSFINEKVSEDGQSAA